jgi:hypothetical protein
MFMLIKNLPVILLGLTFTAHGATWKESSYTDINQLYPVGTGMAFYTTYADASVSACDFGKRFIIPMTAENYGTKVSSLIAAFMANKKVLLRYDSDQPKACAAIVDRFIIAK